MTVILLVMGSQIFINPSFPFLLAILHHHSVWFLCHCTKSCNLHEYLPFQIQLYVCLQLLLCPIYSIWMHSLFLCFSHMHMVFQLLYFILHFQLSYVLNALMFCCCQCNSYISATPSLLFTKVQHSCCLSGPWLIQHDLYFVMSFAFL